MARLTAEQKASVRGLISLQREAWSMVDTNGESSPEAREAQGKVAREAFRCAAEPGFPFGLAIRVQGILERGRRT